MFLLDLRKPGAFSVCHKEVPLHLTLVKYLASSSLCNAASKWPCLASHYISKIPADIFDINYSSVLHSTTSSRYLYLADLLYSDIPIIYECSTARSENPGTVQSAAGLQLASASRHSCTCPVPGMAEFSRNFQAQL